MRRSLGLVRELRHQPFYADIAYRHAQFNIRLILNLQLFAENR